MGFFLWFVGGVNYWQSSENVNNMIDEFKLEESVKKDSVDSWLEDYAEWLSTTKCPWIKAHINFTSEFRIK